MCSSEKSTVLAHLLEGGHQRERYRVRARVTLKHRHKASASIWTDKIGRSPSAEKDEDPDPRQALGLRASNFISFPYVEDSLTAELNQGRLQRRCSVCTGPQLLLFSPITRLLKELLHDHPAYAACM